MYLKSVKLIVQVLIGIGALSNIAHAVFMPDTFGYLRNAEISYFAPKSDSSAFALLKGRDLQVANNTFASLVPQQPHCLAVWLGYMQSSPSLWDSELGRLSSAQSPLTYENKFKLATLLFYTYWRDRNPWSTVRDDKSKAVESRILLLALWHQKHDPIVAYSLFDVCTCMWETGVKADEDRKFIDSFESTLIFENGGNGVYTAFTNAKALSWHTANIPPLPKNRSNWRTLAGIVAAHYGSISGTSYSGQEVNGKMELTKLVPTPEQIAEKKYFKARLDSLTQALAAQGLS